MSNNAAENRPEQDQTGGLEGPRPALPAERDELIAMINFIFRTSAGRAPTIGSDWPHVYTPENLPNVSVIRDPAGSEGGKLVASTGVWASDVVVGRVQVRVGGINTVGTLPDYRRHGLGSQVMLAAHATMRRLGCHVGLLSTGIADWYRRLGWEEAGTVRTYRIDAEVSDRLPPLASEQRVRVIHWTGEDDTERVHADLLDDLLRVYHRQRLGARRTAAELRQLMTARQVQRIVLAERNRELQGYLFTQDDRVMEWAGPAETVAGLVRAWAKGDADLPAAQQELALPAPGLEHPLVALLDAARVPYSASYLGMLYLIDPQAVLDIYGVTGVQVEPVDEAFLLRTGTHRVRLDRRQLTKLFFAPEPFRGAGSEFIPPLFPLPFWQWYLEKV